MTKSQKSMTNANQKTVGTISLLLGTLGSTLVWAQSPSSPGSDTLEEIVVTAERRAEDLQKVPISITVVTAARLEDNRVKDLDDLLQTVPGVSFNNAIPGELTVSMRGVSANSGAATVSFLLDDIPLPTGAAGAGGANGAADSLGAPDPRIFDLDRVEVLYGPQGTLFGVSSMGGTIRFVTAQPKLDRFEGSVGGELGSTEFAGGPDYEGTAIANIPLVDDLIAIRAGIVAGHDAGWVDRLNDTGTTKVNDTNATDYVATRVVGLIRISDTFTITPLLLYQENHLDDVPYFESGLPGFEKYANFPEWQDDTTKIGALTIKKDFPSVDLTSITAYSTRQLFLRNDYGDFFYSIASGVLTGINPAYAPLAVHYLDINTPNIDDSTDTIYSEEVRLASSDKDARLQWLIGGFASYTKQRFYQPIVVPGFDAVGNKYLTPVLGFNPLDSTDDTPFVGDSTAELYEYAPFGNITYRILPSLTVGAGLRWFNERQKGTYYSGGLFGPGPGIFVQSPNTYESDHGVNPRYTVNYQLTPSNMLYASVAKGFRPGQSNGEIPTNSSCKADEAAYTAATGKTLTAQAGPDYVWSYEIGSKNMFAAQRVMINASLFYLKWQGIQEFLNLQNYDPTQVCGFGFVANVGEAVSRGGELELQVKLIEGLTVGFSGTIVNAHITSASDEGAPHGAELPYVPQLGGDANLTYLHPLGDGLTLKLYANENFTGNQVRDFVPGTIFHEESHYSVTNLRMGIGRGNWEASLFARNLFDQRPILDLITEIPPGVAATAAGIPPFNTQDTIKPRQVGIGAKVTF